MAVCQHIFWNGARGWVSLSTSVTGIRVSLCINCPFSFSVTVHSEIRVLQDEESSLFLYLEEQFLTLFLVVEGRT